MIDLLIYLLVLCVVFGLIWRFLIPMLPEPFRQFATAILVVILIIILLSLVVPMGSWPLLRGR